MRGNIVPDGDLRKLRKVSPEAVDEILAHRVWRSQVMELVDELGPLALAAASQMEIVARRHRERFDHLSACEAANLSMDLREVATRLIGRASRRQGVSAAASVHINGGYNGPVS